MADQHLRRRALSPHLDLQGLQGWFQVIHGRTAAQHLGLRLRHFADMILCVWEKTEKGHFSTLNELLPWCEILKWLNSLLLFQPCGYTYFSVTSLFTCRAPKSIISSSVQSMSSSRMAQRACSYSWVRRTASYWRAEERQGDEREGERRIFISERWDLLPLWSPLTQCMSDVGPHK